MKNLQVPFWITTIAVFIGLILPILIQDGMFMDGMLYTSVSHNLANGYGSFWFPEFSDTWLKSGRSTFHEHPPLIFGIQSVFFYVLGDSMYVERFYILLTAIITAYFIIIIWRLITEDDSELKKTSWLPIFLWIIVPIVHWTFHSNMQENTMGIFDLAAVYFLLKSIKSNERQFLLILFSGFFIFLASLSKGVPSLFPIGAVGIYWLISKDISFLKAFSFTLLLILVPVVIYLLLMINDQAYDNLNFYINERLLNRIEVAPTVDNRLKTLMGLFSHLLHVIIFSTIMLGIFKLKKLDVSINKSTRNSILLFSGIGLSASLPLMITMVQKDFYFSHSIPYFAIAFALLLTPGIQQLICRIKKQNIGIKIFRITSISLLVLSLIITISFIGKKSRNENILNDVYVIGNSIPDKSIISVNPNFNDWGTQTYQMRYFHISFDKKKQHKYFMVKKGSKPASTDEYKIIPLETETYDLFVLDQ